MASKESKRNTPTRISKAARASQEKLLDELSKNGGVVTVSCNNAGVGRTTYYKWMENPEFAERVKDAKEQAIDKIESMLVSKVYDAERDSDQIRAAEIILKARGKDRGYGVEKREQEHNGELNVNAKIEDVRFELPDNRTAEGSGSPIPPGWETATGG